MEENLLNSDFIDYVITQMNKSTAVLSKIEEFKLYNKQYSKINEIVDKIEDKKTKELINNIIDNFESMSVYEKTYAFYLGMKQAFNTTQLEKA